MKIIKIFNRFGYVEYPIKYKIKFSNTESVLCKHIKYCKYTLNLIGVIDVDTHLRKYEYTPKILIKNRSLEITEVNKDYTFDWR